IDNKGTISGYAVNIYNNSDKGAGIALSYSTDRELKLNNYGVIKGNSIALTYSDKIFISYNNNYGILAGKSIVDSKRPKPLNFGIEILIDSTGNITNIENGSGGEATLEDGTKKTIINGAVDGNDSYTVANGTHYESNIINGAGINKGALVIEAGTSIDNSIINGYNTAIYLENSSQLTATNTTFNGGGLKNDIAVIKGSSDDNVVSVLGTSTINGSVDLGDGNDKLSIGNAVQINGMLNGGAGDDILNLGEASIAKVSSDLNILHDITGFETINTNGNITLFETINVTGANDITLESGNLVLRVDPTVILDGKLTGHALYENDGILISTGGNLVIGLNGLGEGTTISMGGTTIAPETNDSWWKDSDYIKTNSLVLDGKLSEDGKEINITVLESIPLEPSVPVPPVDPPIDPEPPVDPPIDPEPPVDPPIDPEPPVDPPIVIDSLLYEKLNKVYQSIVSAGEIGNLENTTLLEDKTYNESLGELLIILDQIYANNPYTYSLKSSRDSLKLFEDNMSYLTIKPKKDEIIVQGKAIYTGVKNDSDASGKNYYGFDTSYRNYKTTTSTAGGLATFEYGLSDGTSVGFVFGGNNQDINFKGSSKIKGNSLYLGTFTKTDIKNFKFMSGVGYQYTSADADRKVSNKYDSFSTGDKYNISSLNAFVEAKYIYNVKQDWTVEPKVRLSYYYIDQGKVNEGYTPGQISMRTDAVNSNTADVEVGVDFVKSLYLNNGKLNNILSLGVINTIGDKSKELNGYILGKGKDGKKFDIQGVELPKTSGKVSYNLELEQVNGMIYTAGISLEFAKDYNRNVNATVGIGYKF
ncbi:MAG: autotransporter domain-containing protein, partial [Paraclostridium sp.]